jgi:hypothetical protein
MPIDCRPPASWCRQARTRRAFRRSTRTSAAADRLRDVIVDYFHLEANLRRRRTAQTAGPAVPAREK